MFLDDLLIGTGERRGIRAVRSELVARPAAERRDDAAAGRVDLLDVLRVHAARDAADGMAAERIERVVVPELLLAERDGDIADGRDDD